MYRHLMVPLDDSPLTVENRSPRRRARSASWASRVTFFHAKADYEGSSVGALDRVIAPQPSTITSLERREGCLPKARSSRAKRALATTH
jgi:hypothetical protein